MAEGNHIFLPCFEISVVTQLENLITPQGRRQEAFLYTFSFSYNMKSLLKLTLLYLHIRICVFDGLPEISSRLL